MAGCQRALCLIVLCVVTSWPHHVLGSGTGHRRSDDTDLQSLMAVVQQQAATIQRQEAVVETMQAQLTQLQQVVANHTTSLGVVNTQLDTRVFFTAHMHDRPVTLSSDSPIRFEDVVTNMGGAYNPVTGVFTAPVAGVYVLYAQLMKQSNTPTIHWAIDKSGTALCMNALDVPNNYDKSSCLATSHLQTGEQVVVRRENDGITGVSLEGYWWCSFSGYLVSVDV